MNVSPHDPFQIIYSLYQFENFGYLFQSYIVQLDSQGKPSLLYQNISSKNVREFASGLDETDYELVKLIDACQKDVLLKKFNTKKQPPADFFIRLMDPEKGDKLVREALSDYLDRLNARILGKSEGKQLYISGRDGNPAWKPIDRKPGTATVLFHLFRNDENTHYFPTIRYENTKVEFLHKNALLICEFPAWLLVDETLYHFEGMLDGKKLKPFFGKRFIPIPRKMEEAYLEKFVLPLLASHDVIAKGYEIRKEVLPATAALLLTQVAEAGQTDLFNPPVLSETGPLLLLELIFEYGSRSFKFDSFAAPWYVSLKKQGDTYSFLKIRRDLPYEKQLMILLKKWELNIGSGTTLPRAAFFSWLHENSDHLAAHGIEIRQNKNNKQQYHLGSSVFEVTIRENEATDWFDIHITVQFGPYTIPFVKLRRQILQHKTEFVLPNGEIAIIPKHWFTEYSELLNLMEKEDQSGGKLRKHHLSLVLGLEKESLASVVMNRRLEKLRAFDKIDHYELPRHFNGILRPYQQAGYDWLRFLNDYNFGGCLADDMGLGKTVQTLALLQSQKELGITTPSLLVIPVSLMYNWVAEAHKFTPELRVLVYSGIGRDKSTDQFAHYDLIVTSYGIVRLDIEVLKNFRFHYVILDESQAIKNPSSIITQAVMRFNTQHRLILTGTPLENSTMDLWSQMSFANPGLLGSASFFRKQYLNPIEKNKDLVALKGLYGIIKPFLLRRHKSQVATDLPEKIESLHYCSMTEAQEAYYERIKAQYRNQILEHIDQEGMGKSQFILLQGLGQLRQLANHPVMIDDTYSDDSGKFRDVFHKLDTALMENHKILIFSSFVKHLALFRKRLDLRSTPYAYLDGATKNRQKEVDLFQNDAAVNVFLISIKAGGVGLNLTAADYVFILDPWWNPAVEAQAIDRAHRIGQDKTVFTYKFISRNTVEEKILALQQKKKALADNLITTEEGFVKSLTKEDVLLLLE